MPYRSRCKCDETRRSQCAVDGWTMHCGKCHICGDWGHFRPFPGPLHYSTGWCDLHYDALSRIRRKDMTNAINRSHGSIEIAINLLRHTMKVDKYRHEDTASLFLEQYERGSYERVVREYFTEPCKETRLELFEEFPNSLPTEHKWTLLRELTKRRG